MSAVRECFIQYIRSYTPYWRPFLHPQPEAAPCRGDRDPLITEGKGILHYEKDCHQTQEDLGYYDKIVLKNLKYNETSLNWKYSLASE